MADAVDSKSTAGNGVGVQVPSRAFICVSNWTNLSNKGFVQFFYMFYKNNYPDNQLQTTNMIISCLYIGVRKLEDQDILDMYFKRDEAAITETRGKYGLRLFKVAKNILHINEDAEECVNDTLLKAWEAIPPVRPERFGAFLAKITRNLSINRWQAKAAARRGGGEVSLILDELADCIPATTGTPEAEYESGLVQEAVNSCLASMDKASRAVFVLRYFHNESIKGVSERFGMSESKVKSMLFRARKKLSAHLEKEGVSL